MSIEEQIKRSLKPFNNLRTIVHLKQYKDFPRELYIVLEDLLEVKIAEAKRETAKEIFLAVNKLGINEGEKEKVLSEIRHHLYPIKVNHRPIMAVKKEEQK